MKDDLKVKQAKLLAQLKKAVAAANKIEHTVTTAKAELDTAQKELVSRSKAVGLLLLEAKKLHPAVKDFETFLKKVQGLKLSRAYDCMRIAGGRTTDEEIRTATRDRVAKHRAKKLPGASSNKPKSKLISVTSPDVTESAEAAEEKPEPKISVTSGNVTESAEASGEKRKAQNADLDLTPEEKAAKVSAHNLAEFGIACRMYLPKITVEADRQKARLLVSELTGIKPQMKAA